MAIYDGNEIESKDYAFSGKIMLIAIVILFIIIIIMLCLHVYVRRSLVNTRRRQQLRRSNRPQFVFYMDPAARIARTGRGLHPSVISTLPVFTFSAAMRQAIECAVCLSEFENEETGRVLPKCNHSFHTECIDMWFQSHATCPLCREPVEAMPARETRTDVSVIVCEPEPVASSSTSFRNEESLGSATESSFRSPVSRILSFKRILSREKKGSIVGRCSSMTELDVEQQREDSCDSVPMG